MSQKVNPKNYRLGFFQSWLINFQNYGNKNSLFNYQVFNFQKLLNKDLNINNIIIIYNDSSLNNYSFFINYFLFAYNLNLKQLLNLNKLNSYWNYINPFLALKIRFYLMSEVKYYTENFLSEYINYLYNNLNYSVKKIFSCLIFIFTKKLNKQKICLSKYGYKSLKLKGFKLELKGRLDSTKTPMAKKIINQCGKVSVSELKLKIDFLNLPVYTKSGTCNFKIWFFYTK